ncbi:hypothetical protein CEW92_02560 [Bacillaceae bacterium SAS-127]|nr:hypothetical protein CEW92_02560 [Bacillaceae bacterium SAS-127]
MKNITSIIKRFIITTFLVICLLIVLNILMYIVFFSKTVQSYQAYSPEKLLATTSTGLTENNGKYQLDMKLETTLREANIWVILINQTGQVIWALDVPEAIPKQFNLIDVSRFSRYYLEDYPVFTWSHSGGLLVFGYPKDSYTKINNDYPMSAINGMPLFILFIIIIDLSILLLLYILITRRMNRALSPIVEGIIQLSKGVPVRLTKKEPFSAIVDSINRTSTYLQQKNQALRLKEQNREKWIEGISHDIRTPLSLITGYSDKLKNSKSLNDTDLQLAHVITEQSIIIKELIENLNFVSHLESNGLNMTLVPIFPLKIVRKIMAEILNHTQDETYQIFFDANNITTTQVLGNEHLFKRAISNIVLNSMKHNPQGCDIYVTMLEDRGALTIIIEDSGTGIPVKTLEEMQHFFEKSQAAKSMKRKGLGLLIVNEIVTIHTGDVTVACSIKGGLKTTINIPIFLP